MAIEQTLTADGNLKEVETVESADEYSPAQITDKINALNSEISGLEDELAVWEARQTKLTELQG